MSYASGTTHYNLPQTVGSDKRDWTDTNQAFADIDAAIYGAAQGASAATSAIETINGEIETITEKQAEDEGNISTLSGKVSTLESTVGTQGAAIADVRQDLQDNIESKREASATSTHAYEIGDTFYYNDVLYKATAPIAIGGTIVPSTNCTAVTVMSELQNIDTGLKGWTKVWENADPTASFSPTEVNVDNINSYKEFLIHVERNNLGSIYQTLVLANILNMAGSVVFNMYNDSNVLIMYTRSFSIAASGISIGQGGDGKQIVNTCAVPVAIYAR